MVDAPDGGPEIVAEEKADIIGAVINLTADKALHDSSKQVSPQLIAVRHLCVDKSC